MIDFVSLFGQTANHHSPKSSKSRNSLGRNRVMRSDSLTGLAVVVIGRNERSRLAACLRSVIALNVPVVYVDSGSTDGSDGIAHDMGVDVARLEADAQPLSAARARNAGARYLRDRFPSIEYIQFVDGDCELARGWPAVALDQLRNRSTLGVCCGVRQEKDPDASIYNLLCDLEWRGPFVDAAACGGDMMVRVEYFDKLGGFDGDLIAGEEPDLCFRMRSSGWSCSRLPIAMTTHDAGMYEFRQWWTRAVRSGHAFAEVSHRHATNGFWVRERYSILFWAVVVPGTTAFLALLVHPGFAVLIAAYPVQLYRIYRKLRMANTNSRSALLYSCYCILGKFPQMLGVLSYYYNVHIANRRTRLIEYKW